MTTKEKEKAPQRWAPNTRVEELPALPKGIKIPTGYVPAYFRKRKGLAVLRSEKNKHYLIFDINTGKTRQAESTKETSILMSKIAHGTARLR